MARYRKRPVIREAVQWFKHGDHDVVLPYGIEPDGRVNYCKLCGKSLEEHGFIEVAEGKLLLCPGDWIIQEENGEYYPCKPDIFEACYEKVE
jgi:hypothetical protein